MTVTPGVTYEFAASARLEIEPTSAYSPVGVRLLIFGDNPNVPLASNSDTFYGTGWVDLRGYLVAPTGAKTASVTLQMPGNSGQIATFDNVSLRALPPSAEFNAGPTLIAAGQPATLVWATSSTPNVTIEPGLGARPTTGSVTVHPTQTTTYTLTASGPLGSVTKQVTITVVPPPTATFTATPEAISSGESATLAWTTANAMSVTLDGGIGSQPLAGSALVSPTTTTTYTLTADGIGGTITRQVTITITVVPAPTILFTASPDTIFVGQAASLSWIVANATSVVIDSGVGPQPPSGTLEVHPQQTVTYLLTATGPGGIRVAQATVIVRPPTKRRAVRH
jgi:hypothetical protein